MIKSLFTKEQLQDLRKEFVKFKLADMTSEDLFAYIRDIMMNELIDLYHINNCFHISHQYRFFQRNKYYLDLKYMS